MSDTTTYDPAEYVRLLRVASKALAKARIYGESWQQWRPSYADLILLESMDGWLPEDDAALVLACPPDEAMRKVVEANKAVEIPVEVWEYYDEDAERELADVGIFATREEESDDE